jgi:anthranilate synthase component 1
MDMAIALRTMVIMPEQGQGDRETARWRVYLQAGGGIVADSEPEAEHQETVDKAAALAKAVDLAERAFTETTEGVEPAASDQTR